MSAPPDGRPVPTTPDRLDLHDGDSLAARLFPRLATASDWDLERVRSALADVGDPHLAVPALHVGGTNGKGSVAAMLSAALRASGLRVGLYTSPHLVSYRERFRIDGRPVDDADLLVHAEAVREAVVRHALTFFEAATVLAFHRFGGGADRVDVLVAEVGLGGRLDATNVLRPVVSVITNVGVDHAEWLGTTVEAIAREKAGIAKPETPLVTAAEGPALEVIREVAAATGAPLIEVDAGAARAAARTGPGGTEVTLERHGWPGGALRTRVPLVGPHQAVNLVTAVRALERLRPPIRPTREALERGLAATDWPGRGQVLERSGVRVVLDVAHNPDGAAALCGTLEALDPPRPRVGLVGVLADKDWETMLATLAPRLDGLVLTTASTAPEGRRWDPSVAADLVRARSGTAPGAVEAVHPFDDALRRALELARGGTLVVTGSVHTVGAALRALEGPPAATPGD